MKKCELLVPAGGVKQFIAAVENGADAVYVGGRSFNARINAGNFSDEEMEQAIDYAHLRNVKIYIAMNTLLNDGEIEEAYGQAKKYYSMGADALIIQDLGFGRVIKERLPDFPLHLSTQAGVYDAEGVLAAKKLGYERAVLARELSFDEIKQAAGTGIEIEVFVHGALCLCYSGQCQLSRFIGGRSGNRGMCAQPCRLPYKGLEGAEYPLSPKDLCLIEEVGKLAEAGVASLKIEGRMKSPEYVATVTSIYRKYLDLWQREGCYEVEPKDFEALKQAFNRGGFTKGYFYGNPGENLMSCDFSKNGGVYVGTVQRNANGPLAVINTEKNIVKGDYIEIRSKELAGNLVTYAERINKSQMRIGDIKAKVRRGDKVYRITSYELAETAKNTFENLNFTGGKFVRKVPADMELEVAKEGLSLTVSSLGESVMVKSEVLPQRSLSRKSCADVAKAQLAKTGGTCFKIESIVIKESVPSYIPVSAVNSLRRKALSMLQEKIKNAYKRIPGESYYEAGCCEGSGMDKNLELYFYDKKEFFSETLKPLIYRCLQIAGEKEKVIALVPIEQYEECRKRASEFNIRLRPYVANMNKGKNKRWIEENLERIAETLRRDRSGVYVGNIGQIELFKKAGIDVYGDFGLNITNSYAVCAYQELGMKQWTESLECKERGFGSIPLMITEHRFDDCILTDRKGARYEVKFDKNIQKTVIKSHMSDFDWEKIKKYYEEKGVRLYF